MCAGVGGQRVAHRDTVARTFQTCVGTVSAGSGALPIVLFLARAARRLVPYAVTCAAAMMSLRRALDEARQQGVAGSAMKSMLVEKRREFVAPVSQVGL